MAVKGYIGAAQYGEQKAMLGARFYDTDVTSTGSGGGPVPGASVTRLFPVESGKRVFPLKNALRMYPVT